MRTFARSFSCLVLFLTAMVGAGLRGLVSAPVSEYQVKAAFLYDFAKFVEWPPDTFTSPREPFHICILGEDPFGNSLNEIIAGKMFQGRSFVARRIHKVEQAQGCNIVFISRSEKRRLPMILGSLGKSRILTVADSEGWARQGVMINFTLEDDKVHFEINVTSARQAGIKISSKLLSLVKIVH